ncbi:hypothetical protein Hanom_Chr13g01211011 [Helianthus anomalus]
MHICQVLYITKLLPKKIVITKNSFVLGLKNLHTCYRLQKLTSDFPNKIHGKRGVFISL